MNINDFCAPALLYVAFSLTHIIVDMFKKLYNTALVKFIVMIMFTFLLNVLCQRGLTIISWFIVFIPFITMTVITTLLLITFGLSPFSGKIDKSHLVPEKQKRYRDRSDVMEECQDRTYHDRSQCNKIHHDDYYN